MRIGVLALQGDFERHVRALQRCRGGGQGAATDGVSSERGLRPRNPSEGRTGGGHSGGAALAPPDLDQVPPDVVEIRQPEQLAAVDGLVIPGGESTTLLNLMNAYNFVPALEKFHGAGRPIFGTCAGLILLARDVDRPRQFSLGFLDVAVERNAYGRQRESFEAHGVADLDGPVPLEMVFIRAPRIRRVGESVQTLASHGGEAVMARQGTVLVATFHPELTDDPTVHAYFVRMVQQARGT